MTFSMIMRHIFKLKREIGKTFILCIMYAFVSVIITIQEQTILVKLLTFFITASFMFFNFEIKKSLIIVLTILFHFIIATSEWTFMFINESLQLLDVSNSNSISYVIASCIIIVCFSLLTFVFSNLLSILKNDTYSKLNWLLMVFPIFTFGLIVLIPDYYDLVIEKKALMFSLLGLIASNFIMLYFYTYSIKAIHLDSELTMIKSKQEYLEEKVQLVNQHYAHSFNYLHRFLHECNDLNYFVETKDMDNIAALAKKMGEEAGKEFNMIYSNSLALNTVLQQKNDRIQELSVSIMTTILCDLKGMELSDQIELYEILLNHALDNCKQFDVNNRLIRIVLKEINSNIAIQMISPNQDKEDLIERLLKDMIKKYSMRYNRKVEENKEMILLLL